MRGRWKERLQDLVIRTSPWPPLRWAYAAVYALALAWLVLRLRRVREVRTLDLRLPRAGHCFGSSDLDLRAETMPLSTERFFALADGLARVLLPGGTWRRIFDVYLFSAAEHELQQMVVAQSIGRERRMVRLVGARASAGARPAPSPDAPLGRVVFDYGAMCQELFEAPLTLHHTRLLYCQVARIDAERAAVGADPEGVAPATIEEVRRLADAPARRGRVRHVTFDTLAQAHAVALAHATALAREALARTPDESVTSIATVPAGAPPETRARAVDACRDPIAELCADGLGAVSHALLAAIPGTRWEYRPYLVLREGVTLDEHVALCRRVRALFVTTNPRISYDYFRLRYPLLLTPLLWQASGRWFHALRPLEEYHFLARYGAVLYGDGSPPTPAPPGGAAVVRSAAVGVADLRNRIWGAIHHRLPVQLADLLGGRVPALWLVLARGRVATSPSEAVAACVEAGMPHAAVLHALDARLTGVKPAALPDVDDPFWQPARAALSDWLDELVAAAVAALRTPGSP